MRIIYMGTPDFAVPALEALIDSEHEVISVYTQPDKQKGRGKAMAFPPVKECAIAHNIPVYQPAKVKDQEVVDEIRRQNPDVIVVAAFGQILPKDLLCIPRYGCMNIHASLLPKYRGAAPIQWAVIDGQEKTGISIMQMDEGLDTGDILGQEEISIAPDETGGSLFDKLAKMGGPLILSILKDAESGNLHPVKQDSALSNYAHMLSKKSGAIDFSQPAVHIECLIRGLNPWPSAYTHLHGKLLKIWAADVLYEQADAAPGTIVKADKQGLVVATGDGQLSIKELQLEGKKRMDVHAFLAGYHLEAGTVLE